MPLKLVPGPQDGGAVPGEGPAVLRTTGQAETPESVEWGPAPMQRGEDFTCSVSQEGCMQEEAVGQPPLCSDYLPAHARGTQLRSSRRCSLFRGSAGEPSTQHRARRSILWAALAPLRPRSYCPAPALPPATGREPRALRRGRTTCGLHTPVTRQLPPQPHFSAGRAQLHPRH